jgi:hypothetical protein
MGISSSNALESPLLHAVSSRVTSCDAVIGLARSIERCAIVLPSNLRNNRPQTVHGGRKHLRENSR